MLGGIDIVAKAIKKEIQKKRKHSVVVQTHHISYKPEITVRIWKGEHWIIHQLLRRKRISKGFIEALKTWINQWEKYAEDLK